MPWLQHGVYWLTSLITDAAYVGRLTMCQILYWLICLCNLYQLGLGKADEGMSASVLGQHQTNTRFWSWRRADVGMPWTAFAQTTLKLNVRGWHELNQQQYY